MANVEGVLLQLKGLACPFCNTHVVRELEEVKGAGKVLYSSNSAYPPSALKTQLRPGPAKVISPQTMENLVC